MAIGFFQKYTKALERSYRLLDITLIAVSGYIAYYIKVGSLQLSTEAINSVLMAVLISHVVFKVARIYQVRRGQSLTREVITLLIAWAIVLLILTLIAYATKTGSVVSREWASITALLTASLLVLLRVVIRIWLRKVRRDGKNRRNAVIYGAGKLGVLVANKLQKESWTGTNVLGFFDDNVGHTQVAGLPVYGSLSTLFDMIEQSREDRNSSMRIDQVWITLPLTYQIRINEAVEVLQKTSVQIQFVPDWIGAEILKYPIDRFAGISILNMSAPRIVGLDAMMKNTFDKVFATLVLVLIWPIMLIIAILIKVESKGSVIFKQRRYGIEGNEIEVWKFRSMIVSEDGDKVHQATKGDSRVTKVGKIIRKYSLDELPQFVNVLQGTMSVVGPRPHAVAHNEYYRNRIPNYMGRHIVKPGITGWAQVNGWRGETDTADKMQQRVKFDLEYISTWNLGFDLKIILLTMIHGFRGKSAY